MRGRKMLYLAFGVALGCCSASTLGDTFSSNPYEEFQEPTVITVTVTETIRSTVTQEVPVELSQDCIWAIGRAQDLLTGASGLGDVSTQALDFISKAHQGVMTGDIARLNEANEGLRDLQRSVSESQIPIYEDYLQVMDGLKQCPSD